ncbi:MAG: DUF1971 domain-containing protein [Janthinobacterium lividum]
MFYVAIIDAFLKHLWSDAMNDPSQSQAKPKADTSQTHAVPPAPYRSTPIFDETTLPPALLNVHSLKPGTWGQICVIEGQLKLTYCDPHATVTLSPERPGLIQPQQAHFVEPLGAIKMRIDFYDRQPDG